MGVHPKSKMKDRIYQLMLTTGKTQKDFAAELCIAQASLSAILKGTTKPSAAVVAAVHERFPEVSVNWLMFGEGDMYVSHGTVGTESRAMGAEQDPVLDETHVQGDLFSTSAAAPSAVPVVREVVKYLDKPQRRITEIRVFYDDGTYETFS